MIAAALLVSVLCALGTVPAAQAQAAPPTPYQAWDWPGQGLDATRNGLPADTLRSGPPDEWLGRDKALHAGGSFLLTLSAQYVLVSKAERSERGALPLSATAALGLGLAKEVFDSRRGRFPLFSWRDLAADALGVALAAGLILW